MFPRWSLSKPDIKKFVTYKINGDPTLPYFLSPSRKRPALYRGIDSKRGSFPSRSGVIEAARTSNKDANACNRAATVREEKVP